MGEGINKGKGMDMGKSEVNGRLTVRLRNG